MKILLVLVTVVIGCLSQLPESKVTEVSETIAFPPTAPTPSPTPVYVDDEEGYEFDDVLDYQGSINVYTRQIAKRTILRSKPWEDSKPNLETVLVPGDIVQIYPNPMGESEWVEIWVPRYRITGYVRMIMLGEVK